MKQREAMQLTLRTARRQGNAITRRQALGLGVQDEHLAALVQAGMLSRVHPGVYVDGGRSGDPLVKVVAASLFLGGRGVISHQSAAWLLGLVDRLEPLVHATVVHRSHYGGIRFHVVGTLPVARPIRGVRCTTPARTIVDMAPSLTGQALNGVVDRGLVSRVTSLDELRREAAGHRRGSAMLRRSLEGLGHIGAPDESQLEAEMRRLIRRYGLPAPQVQVRAGPDGRFRVDCCWPEWRLVVELYGYVWHHSAEQLKHDLARQRQLVAEGWQVIGYTWRDVKYEPDRVAEELRQALRPAC